MSFINALWIDPESSFIDRMKEQLQEEYRIQHFVNFNEEQAQNHEWTTVDLVLMELKTLDNTTLRLVPLIRQKKSDLPILIVTAHADLKSCIEAINHGVNGFAEKPLEAERLIELLSRFRSKGFQLKMSHDRKAVFSQNSWVDLTSTEYKILQSLKNAKRRLTRTELQAFVWPNSSISENNLDTHLTNLKRKIPELNQCLNVKRGLGYYLDIHGNF